MKSPPLCALVAALWLVGCAPAAQPTSTPTMPHNYAAVFGDEQLDDLIAYLLTL